MRDFATNLELDGDQGSEDIHNFRKFSENAQSNLNLPHSQSLSNYFRPDAQRAYAEQMAKFFAGMAHRTGVYRFKYKVARQLGQLVLLGRLRRSSAVEGIRNTFEYSFSPFLQIYCHQLRSLTPLLEGYLRALVGRIVSVRVEGQKVQRATAQRKLNVQLQQR